MNRTLVLDVTEAVTPKWTGVERMIHAILRECHQRLEVIPVVWDERRAAYTSPLPEEAACLNDPGQRAAGRPPTAKPEGRLRSLGAVRWWRSLRRRHLQLDKATLLAADFALLPAHLHDGRSHYWNHSRGRRARLIAICHDLIPWEIRRETNRPTPTEEGAWLDLLSLADQTIVPSQTTARLLERAWLERGRRGRTPQVLPWPIEPPLATPRPDLHSCLEQVRQQPPSILMVASLTARKNHQRLLKACQNLHQEGVAFKLILVGREGRDGAPIRQRIAEARRHGVPVTWQRHIDEASLVGAYHRASFTVFPSLREGFGLPVQESLWFGRPCLCSDVGAVAEVAVGGGCLTIPPQRLESLIEGLRQMITQPELREDLARQALARSFPTWDAWIQHVLDLPPQ